MRPEDVCQFRNKKAGFVFQFHYLISELSVLENVLLPTMRDNCKKEKNDFARYLLEQLGLQEKLKRFPRQLSGGEAQRVAIARALIMQPKYIFADEPTGSLDSANGEQIMKMLLKANVELHATVILVTHDSEFANMARRQVHLSDGKICD
jgi:putative ABC transport system ATP-binding protein/lipoprotein-releasing system ATP-binding protein